MPQPMIILPVAAQVFLTLAVLWVMGLRRQSSLRKQKKTVQDMALADDGDWTEPAAVASRNFKNQFELPVLFYVACAFILMTRTLDYFQFALAWAFVVSRLVHAYEHLGPNRVIVRGTAFIVGYAIIALMWVLLLWTVISTGF